MFFNTNKFDAFIVHAVEDKQTIANAIYQKLSGDGFKIWYSSEHLVPGENLVSVIHKGLRLSRCGIIIISPNFLEKRWPQREYHILLAADVAIIPIRCDVTADQLASFDPDLTNIYSLDIAKGIDNVVERIKPALAVRRKNLSNKRLRTYGGIFAALILLICAFVFKVSWDSHKRPSPVEIRQLISNRVHDSPESSIALPLLSSIQVSSKEKVIAIASEFAAQKSYYRNEYEFSNSTITVRGRDNVQQKLNVDPTKFLLQKEFRLVKATEIPAVAGKPRQLHYILANTDSVSFALTDGKYDDVHKVYDVIADYEHNIRTVAVDLTFAINQSGRRRNFTSIRGFFPRERYRFKKTSHGWVTDKILLPEED